MRDLSIVILNELFGFGSKKYSPVMTIDLDICKKVSNMGTAIGSVSIDSIKDEDTDENRKILLFNIEEMVKPENNDPCPKGKKRFILIDRIGEITIKGLTKELDESLGRDDFRYMRFEPIFEEEGGALDWLHEVNTFGFTTLLIMEHQANALAKEIKKINQKIKIIDGGKMSSEVSKVIMKSVAKTGR